MELLFQGIYFIFALSLAFFIPGDILLKKLKLTGITRFTLATIVGMVIFMWQGYIFGILNTRFATYLYLIGCFLLWFKFYRKSRPWKNINFNVFQIDFVLFTSVVIGICLQVSRVWYIGVSHKDSVHYCCGEIMDALWHVSLTQEITKRIPPFEPGMHGKIIENYHYWSDMVSSELARVFNLPVDVTQYQFMMVFLALFLALAAISFAKTANLSNAFTRWLIFFLFFGGDAIVWLMVILGKGFNFQMSSLVDGARLLDNPPTAFSIVMFFALLSLLLIFIKKPTFLVGVIIALIAGTLVGVKVYTGIFVFVGLISIGVIGLFQKRVVYFLPFLVSVPLSFIVFKSVNSGTSGIFYSGFWRFEEFIVQPPLGIDHLELARIIYRDHNNKLRVLQYELMYMGIYFVAIFGTKLLGLIQSKKSLALLPFKLHIFLISGMAVSFVLGSFFIQNAGGANSFQFLGNVFIIGSIYAALTCSHFLKNKPKVVVLIVSLIIVVLTIPRVLHEESLTRSRILTGGGISIPKEEFEAFTYIKGNTLKTDKFVVDTRSFFLDYITPYMGYYADRPMFFSGQRVAGSHDVYIPQRKRALETIFYDKNEESVKKVFLEQNISYMISSPSAQIAASRAAFFKEVYRNKEIKILKFEVMEDSF